MSRDYFEIRYEICDGYIGGSRPQTVRVSADDVLGTPPDKLNDVLWDIVHEDASQKIDYDIKNIDEAVEWAKARIADEDEQ